MPPASATFQSLQWRLIAPEPPVQARSVLLNGLCPNAFVIAMGVRSTSAKDAAMRRPAPPPGSTRCQPSPRFRMRVRGFPFAGSEDHKNANHVRPLNPGAWEAAPWQALSASSCGLLFASPKVPAIAMDVAKTRSGPASSAKASPSPTSGVTKRSSVSASRGETPVSGNPPREYSGMLTQPNQSKPNHAALPNATRQVRPNCFAKVRLSVARMDGGYRARIPAASSNTRAQKVEQKQRIQVAHVFAV